MTDKFALAYREQQQLLISDGIAGILFKIGGLSALIARALVQFFYLPWLGVLTTWLLACICAVSFFWPFRKEEKSFMLLPFAIAAALFVPFASADNALHYDSHIAYTFAALAFGFGPGQRKLIGRIVTIFTLYIIAGPAALLYALAIATRNICTLKDRKALLSLIYPAIALVLCLCSFWSGSVGTAATALGPGFFHEVTKQLPSSIAILWFILPICVGLTNLPGKTLQRLSLGSLILAVAAVFMFASAGKFISDQEKAEYEYEYYAANEMWPELEKASAKHMNRYFDANYHNLAKAKNGKLADQLFAAPQHTPSSLLHMEADHTSDARMARVLMAMGDIAGAQSVAFNALPSFSGIKPEMLKILVKIELMRGNYTVACKYLSFLGRAPHYKSWAEEYSRFIDNEELLMSNEELRNGRLNLTSRGAFVVNPTPMPDMLAIMDVNADDWGTVQYALSYLLLTKDFNSVYEFVDKYYGKGCFTRLPQAAQEAVVFFSDYYHTTSKKYATEQGIAPEKWEAYQAIDADWCIAHGVSENTVKSFLQFKQLYTSRAPLSSMQNFRHTFWYYLVYEKI